MAYKKRTQKEMIAELREKLASNFDDATGEPITPRRHIVEAMIYRDRADYEANMGEQDTLFGTGRFLAWSELSGKLEDGRVVDFFVTRKGGPYYDDELMTNVVTTIGKPGTATW